MKQLSRTTLAALAFVSAFAALPAAAQQDEEIMTERARRSLENFMHDPDLRWLRENAPKAQAILVVPEMVKLGLILGVSGGTGVAYRRDAKGGWTGPVFYTLTSGSLGIQVGAQVSEVILVMTSERGAERLTSNSFKLGPDASVAAGPVGVGAAGAPIADVVSYSRTQGLFVGLSLEGTVISPRDDWNREYYGSGATASDVLSGKAGGGKGADARAAVQKILGGN